MAVNRTVTIFLKKIIVLLMIMCIVPVVAAYGWFSSSTPVIEFSQAGDLPSPLYAKSDNDNGNSGGNSGGSSSGGNSGGNSDNSNSGGNSGGGSSGGNSGGNSDSSNSGGNSGGGSSGGNSGGNSDSSNSGGNSGGGSSGGNSGGNSDNSNSGGNSGGGSSGGNSGGNSDNSNSGNDKGKSDTGADSNVANAGGAQDKDNSGGNAAATATKANQGTGTPISISGSHISSRENVREIVIDKQKATDAGETIVVKGSTITFSKGPISIGVITLANPTETKGVITADIRSISMEYQPVTARLGETGSVSASFKADLLDLPPSDATITAVIEEKPGPAAQTAFEKAVSDQGYQLDAMAYTMDVVKINLNDGKDIGSATITMSVAPAWVVDHGGVDGIRIARFADDGTSQMLETRFVGFDSSENQVFEGISPGGLSIFALIYVKAHEEAIAKQSLFEPAAPGSVSLNGTVDRGTAISNTPYSSGFLFNDKVEINFFKGDRLSFILSRFTRDF